MSRNITTDFSNIVVVIPTLNEEEGIGWVLDRVHQALKGRNYHIVVVDGGSNDKTVEIAISKGAKVIFQNGEGYGDAYIKGFDYALQKLKPDIIVMLDADGTYDPLEMPKLLEIIEKEEVDMVIGNRFEGMQKKAMSAVNKIGNKLLSFLARLMIGINIKDTQSGYRAIKKVVLEAIHLTKRGMPFATELIVEAFSHGFKIKEIPITYRKRIGGKPKLNPIRDGWRILKTIVHFSIIYNPVFSIFTIGASLLIPGLILGAYTAYHYFFTGIKFYIKGLIAVILTLSGFNSLLLAILSLYFKRLEIRLQRQIKLISRKQE